MKNRLKRKAEYAKKYAKEIKELLRIIETTEKNQFILDMYNILNSGSRVFTEKMHNSVLKIINSPQYDSVKQIEAKKAIEPYIEKVNKIWDMVNFCDGDKHQYYIANYSALPFVESVKKHLETRFTISKKQMESLNKVYKKYKPRYEKKIKLIKKNDVE